MKEGITRDALFDIRHGVTVAGMLQSEGIPGRRPHVKSSCFMICTCGCSKSGWVEIVSLREGTSCPATSFMHEVSGADGKGC